MRVTRASTRDGGAQSELLHELIQQRGLKASDYALFFVTVEGEELGPRGGSVNEMSGYVMDKHGRAFSFWVGWDSVSQEVTLTEWREVQPERHWADNLEYCRVRAGLGLPAAKR